MFLGDQQGLPCAGATDASLCLMEPCAQWDVKQKDGGRDWTEGSHFLRKGKEDTFPRKGCQDPLGIGVTNLVVW